MTERMPDPVGKASLLKDKLAQDAQQKQVQKTITETAELKEELDKQEESKRAFDEEREGLLVKDEDLKNKFSRSENDRTELKRKGKEALKEVSSVEGGLETIRTNKEIRDEVFGDTITALKRINELRKTGPKQRAEIRDSLNVINQSHLEEATMLLEKIRNEHPEYITAKETIERYTTQKGKLNEYENRATVFSQKYPERLSDHVSYDKENYTPIDITLNQEIKESDKAIKEAELAYEAADKEKEAFRKTKKGFFESQSSYDAKLTEFSNVSKTAHEKYNELWEKKRKLDSVKYEFTYNRELDRLFGNPMDYICPDQSEISELVKDTPTIETFIVRMKEVMQKKLDALQPTEKELTLASLVSLVESKKRVIETRPYHK